ncbi:hypothetical protein [Streptomyces hirsutus]|uniref:hypothetical protein n=1 Tax=Streptomyces hirsutus TaxID=35620 RepID=UPI0036531794
MAPLDYGAPKAAADLADQARHAAGSGPTAAAALAAAVAARAYSLNHQPVRLSRLPTPSWRGSPEGERSDTWLTYGEQKHHVHLSHAFTSLGDTEAPGRTSSVPWSCPR